MPNVPRPLDLQRHEPAVDGLAAPSLVEALARTLEAVPSADTTLTLREREALRARMAHAVGALPWVRWRPEGVPAGDELAISEDLYVHAQDVGWSVLSERERYAMLFGQRFVHEPERLRGDAGFWSKLRELFEECEIADMALVAGAWVGAAQARDVLDVVKP